MARDISNSDDLIDIRDVIARYEELRDEREDLENTAEDAEIAYNEARKDEDETTLEEVEAAEKARDDACAALTDWEDAEGYATLKSLLEELEGSGGDHQWEGAWYPVTLIRDSYFKEYAKGFADDIGAIDRGATWPLTCINWDQAARELQMDYSIVYYDGVTYWYR